VRPGLPFQTLFHADWSVDPRKRWVTQAVRRGDGWFVTVPNQVVDAAELVNAMFTTAGPVLAGFDFPIGLPMAYAQRAALADFAAALNAFGHDEWADFYHVAATPEEISITRPFYPLRANAGAKRSHLLRALGLDHIDLLRRRCDYATPARRAAAPLFWTVGPNQVGKAAITGWREVLIPARARGARLWPFEGTLATLADPVAPVLAEAYPAEACSHIGVHFLHAMSKRRQADRRQATAGLLPRAQRTGVVFAAETIRLIETGFGSTRDSEDSFDSLIGLLGLIEVADGRRAEYPPEPDGADRWEGWILGQINRPAPPHQA
jgi:hypothetical protein